MKHLPPSTPSNPFAELSAAWTESWTQPWSAWQTWSRLWGEQWQRWFDALATTPTPWLPALAEGRTRQPAAIDFFLPWLPRADFRVSPTDADAGRDTVHAMLRAAVPAAGLFGVLAYRSGGDEGVIDVEPAAPLSLVASTVESPKRAVPVKRSPRKATATAKAPAVKKARSAKPAGGEPVAAAAPAPASAAAVAPAGVKKPKATARKAARPAEVPTSGTKPEGT